MHGEVIGFPCNGVHECKLEGKGWLIHFDRRLLSITGRFMSDFWLCGLDDVIKAT